MHRLLHPSSLLSVALLLGCGYKTSDGSGDDSSSDSGEADADTDDDGGGGRLDLTFAIDPDLVTGTQPVPGQFVGQIYNSEEVGFQPEDGAEVLDDIDLLLLLGTDGRASGVMHTTRLLEYPEVHVLGFMDLNDNYDHENPNPDSSDAVTMPNNNKFDVVTGETTEVVVNLDMLYPGAR